MKVVGEYEGDLKRFLYSYDYHSLTGHLDNLENIKFNQPLINEIVLWKVNRYAELSEDLFEELETVRELKNGQHRQARNLLDSLLNVRGIGLPVASTILRFRNPEVFQIIDQHAYRALYGKSYPVYSSTPTKRKIKVYFDYLDNLIVLCDSKGLDFQTIDRLLYVFDKQENGKL